MKITKKMKEGIKRHIISALVTFISAFLLFLGAELGSDSVTSLDALYGLLFGGAMAGMRALIKVLNEQLVIKK